MDAHCKQGYANSIKAITQSLSANSRRLVFNDCFSPSRVPVLQDLLMGPVHKLSINDSLTSKKIYAAERKLTKVCRIILQTVMLNCNVASILYQKPRLFRYTFSLVYLVTLGLLSYFPNSVTNSLYVSYIVSQSC